MLFCEASKAQSYEVLNYSINGAPVNGTNIKTNIPFLNASQMITLKIEGYIYAISESISLQLVWYVYNDVFTNTAISSSGGYTPEILLTNNNGFVNVYINDKTSYARFKVTAFAKGRSEQSSWFQGWTTADEVIQGTQAKSVPYKNRFKGTVTNQGDLFSSGNMGIGTTDTKGYKLAVNGKIRTQEIKVEATNWPDYVFEEDYKLTTIPELKKFITTYKHLPEIPSAKDIEAEGVNLGEMNKLLVKKIEELTLILIDQHEQSKKQSERIGQLELEIVEIKKNDVFIPR
ncbi:hypothetical protein CPT03_16870 [Pedobacter ginsengisoli]|uniref:Uncharacterized protein n=2 Tax=Pedobacter ginsengisoli TaxID=363852 RepID=A0A2D1U8T0_9SPHI|nr:hypothetical protein CPT03_16870 [Pedobacter ginsengisoli]